MQLSQKVKEAVFSLVQKYLDEPDHRLPVDYRSQQDLKDILNFTLTESAQNSSVLIDFINMVDNFSVNTHHRKFANQLYAQAEPYALLGEILAALYNTSMSTFEISPVATILEDELVKEFCKQVGYSAGDGIMCTGGSNANMLAILCARQRLFPKSKEDGLPNQKLYVFVSDQSHYSFTKAMNLLGMGTNQLVKVKSDDQGKLCLSDLKEQVSKIRKSNGIPLMIACTAGTTVFGAFDPIFDCASFCEKEKIWLHVDGAWGGSVLLSKKHRALLAGADLADSFTWDAHKMMGAPLIASFFLTKADAVLKNTVTGGGSSYLFHKYDNAEFDTGRKSLQCGRKIDSLKVYFSWLALGREGFEKRINRCFELATYLESLIQNDPEMELMQKRESLNICFRFKSDNKDNLRKRDKLVKEGEYLVNYSSLSDGTVFFRMITCNDRLTFSDLEDLVEKLKSF